MTPDESLLKAIQQDITLAPYDADWPQLYELEAARLMSKFSSSIIELQHFGSTAIAGISAKPVIDIIAGVVDMPTATALIEPLCDFGYTTSHEFNATLIDRRWLMRHADGKRTHHLHIVVHDGEQWRKRLAFRDIMRIDAGLRQSYESLKQQLAQQHAADREAYTDAKEAFVEKVSAQALRQFSSSARPSSA